MISETKEEYIELEKKCGLQVGDEVEAERMPVAHEHGWNFYPWKPRVMTITNTPGIIKSVTEPNGQGILVEIDGKQAHYPYFVLKKVKNKITIPLDNVSGKLKYLHEDGVWLESINRPERILNHPDYRYCGSTKHSKHKVYSYYSGHGMLYRFKEE